MKYFTAVAFFIMSLVCYSQIIEENNSQEVPFERKNSNSTHIAAENSAWYNYGDVLRDYASSDMSYFRTVLFPDSTVKTAFSNGVGYVDKHSLGQTFDPGSFLFGFQSPMITLPNYVSYKLDSIGFWYRYFRNQNTAEDTLIIQVFNNSQMVFNNFTNDNRPYSYVLYDSLKGKGINPTREFTYLLDNKDTVSTKEGFLSFPIQNFSVKAGEKLAVTITYIPGNPYNFGDTISPYVTPAPKKQLNAFVMYEHRDNSKFVDNGFYNNELQVPTSVKYNQNQTNWNGKYIAGTAWTSGYYNLDMEFHITTLNLSTNDILINKYNAYIHPNPSSENNNTYVTFETQTTENIVIEIRDITGKIVVKLPEATYVSGKNKVEIPYGVLHTSGVYFCTLRGEKNTSILKMVIK